LRRNAKRVRDAIEKGKHRRDVDRLSDLWLCPPVITQTLNIVRCGAIRGLSHLRYVIQQRPLGDTQTGFVKLARGDGLYCFLFRSLNTQEVSMRVQSIGTAIQPRHPGRDGFLGPPVQMPLGKMNRVAEAHNLAQEVRPVAEALQNSWHLLASRMRSPLVVNLRYLTSSVGVLNEIDLVRTVRHSELIQAKLKIAHRRTPAIHPKD
jgi:hypothetical protein